MLLAMAVRTLIFFLHAFIGVKPLFLLITHPQEHLIFYGSQRLTFIMMYQASGLLDIQGFDEPGAFGLYSILLLYLIKFTFKMQKRSCNFTTMFTFSLAFFYFRWFYFFIFYVNKSNLNIFYSCLWVLTCIFYLSSNVEDETTGMIYDATFKRFEMDDSGLAENNRSALVIMIKVF
jgi:hypothetical protein